MDKPVVVVVGSSGTVGLELVARLSKMEGLTVLTLGSSEAEERRAQTLELADLAVLCLPEQAAIKFAEDAPAGLRILDASPAHRLHPDWTYGLPELDGDNANLIRDSPRVANPGCYATGAILLLRPLVAALTDTSRLQVAITGVGGASSGGRKMLEQVEETPFGYRLYGLDQTHRHIPEIQRFSGLDNEPIFMPGVAGHIRGTIVQIPFTTAHLGLGYQQVVQLLEEAYANQPRVSVVPVTEGARYLQADDLANTDDVRIHVLADAAQQRIVLVAQFDNLGAGAAGAAEQNVRLMLGLG